MQARLMVSAAALVLVAVLPSDAQPNGRGRGHARKAAPIRFQEMDRNNDRVIARSEWQGSDQSFRVHDWDGDGVLSGDEVRPGAEPKKRDRSDADFDGPDRGYRFDDWTARGFTALDHDRDGRITRDEWHFDRETFLRADHNRDGVVARAEFLRTDALDDDRGDRFADLDVDRNGRLSRSEWHGTRQLFDAMDANHDDVVTRVEMIGAEAPPELFSSLDINRDGAIALNEWHWSRPTFDRRDLNHDGRITREEFSGLGAVGTTGAQGGAQSGAYSAGYERGAAEARAQAREDRIRNQGYDAEGQRELETADSGYEPRMGPKADYQDGYRAGWRVGYPEGWRQP